MKDACCLPMVVSTAAAVVLSESMTLQEVTSQGYERHDEKNSSPRAILSGAESHILI
jgi:hypothetical protein